MALKVYNELKIVPITSHQFRAWGHNIFGGIFCDTLSHLEQTFYTTFALVASYGRRSEVFCNGAFPTNRYHERRVCVCGTISDVGIVVVLLFSHHWQRLFKTNFIITFFKNIDLDLKMTMTFLSFNMSISIYLEDHEKHSYIFMFMFNA